MSLFKWKHFLFRKRGLGKIDEIYEPEVEKQAFKGDLAGGPEFGDRNVNGATDSRTREGTGQDGTFVWVSGRKGMGREVGSWWGGVTLLAGSVVLESRSWKAKERKLAPVKFYTIGVFTLALWGEISLPEDAKEKQKNWIWCGCAGAELGMVMVLSLLRGHSAP